MLVLQPLPQRDGKGTEVDHAGGEGLHLELGGAKGARERDAARGQAPGLQGGGLAAVACAPAGRGAWHVVVHVGAAAHATGQVAFDAELVDRGHHGVAREREVFGQVAAGGQAFTSAELAVEHGAAQRLVELAVQGQRVLRAQSVHFGEQEFGQHLEDSNSEAGATCPFQTHRGTGSARPQGAPP
ncbi:hypothetical protein D9M69_566900 [compost metagenome]